MGKGRYSITWMAENEVRDFLSFFIYRSNDEVLIIDNKKYYHIDALLITNYTDRVATEQDVNGNMNPYFILGHYLNEINIENNILDFAEALNTHAYESLIKHLKIERYSIFTQSKNNDKFSLLVRFIHTRLQWQCNGIFGGDLEDGSICRLCISDITNNRQCAYLFHLMEQKNLVHTKWQDIIERRGIAYTKSGKQLTAKDLNSASQEVKLTHNIIYGKLNKNQQKYEEIKRFVESL